MNLLHGDCLELMKTIPDRSVELILCDLPYGYTAANWDNIIPFPELWKEYNRVIKPKGVIALFSDFPFSAELIKSNANNFRYAWYWAKNTATGHLTAKKMPLKKVEHVLIFKPPETNEDLYQNLRNYMISEFEKTGLTRSDINRLLGNTMSSHYFTNGQQFSLPSKSNYEKLQRTGRFKRPLEELKAEWKKEGTLSFTYKPQGLKRLERQKKKKGGTSELYSAHDNEYVQEYTNYPANILYFDNESDLHPTQKPVALLEYLIKTYTNNGATVLDNCMGSGSTGVACVNTGRNFIGIELDDKYFEIAKKRIKDAEEVFAYTE